MMEQENTTKVMQGIKINIKKTTSHQSFCLNIIFQNTKTLKSLLQEQCIGSYPSRIIPSWNQIVENHFCIKYLRYK